MNRSRLPREPRALVDLTASAAAAWYARLFTQGRHGQAPPKEFARSFSARGKEWVVASIPLDRLDYQTREESGNTRIRLAKDYAKIGGEFPPGVGSYRDRSQRRVTCRIYLQDGNHRALAAEFRGDHAIRVLMPAREFLAFLRQCRGR